jgi:hypothetical protein
MFTLCPIFKNSKNWHRGPFKVPIASDSSLVLKKIFSSLAVPACMVLIKVKLKNDGV